MTDFEGISLSIPDPNSMVAPTELGDVATNSIDSFRLVSAVATGPNTIKLRFSREPLVDGSVNSVLNVVNWPTISYTAPTVGYSTNTVVAVYKHPSDTYAVQVQVEDPLTDSNWTVSFRDVDGRTYAGAGPTFRDTASNNLKEVGWGMATPGGGYSTEGYIYIDQINDNAAAYPVGSIWYLSKPSGSASQRYVVTEQDAEKIRFKLAPYGQTAPTEGGSDLSEFDGAGDLYLVKINSYSFLYGTADKELPSVTNDTAAEKFRKFVNPLFVGLPNWDAFTAALATGDEYVESTAQSATQQINLSTASGEYLDARAIDFGVHRPTSTGIEDESFRALALSIINNKLTQASFLQALELIYGKEATRGYLETSTTSPYNLYDGMGLRLLVDEVQAVDIFFNAAEFVDIHQAEAVEVVAAINRAMEKFNCTGFAEEYTDPTTGDTKIRIYSGSRGLGSSIRVWLGTASVALGMPTAVVTKSTGAAVGWTVTVPQPGIARFSLDVAADVSEYDLSLVEIGDYLISLGGFLKVNTGAFKVVDVVYDLQAPDVHIDVENPLADVDSATISSTEYLYVYRSTKRTPFNDTNFVSVTQRNGTAYVSIPATTQAVVRTEGEAAYCVTNTAVSATSVLRQLDGTTTITAAGHGLSVGDWAYIDDVFPAITAPSTVASAQVAQPWTITENRVFGLTKTSTLTDITSNYQVAPPATDVVGRSFGLSIVDSEGDLVTLGGIDYSSSAVSLPSSGGVYSFVIDRDEYDSTTGETTKGYEFRREGGVLSPALGSFGSEVSTSGDILISKGAVVSPANQWRDFGFSTKSELFSKTQLVKEVLSDVQLIDNALDVAKTCDVGSTNSVVTVAGGGLAVNTYTAYKIVFDAATTTVALRNISRIITQNAAANVTVDSVLPAVPVNTDTFKIVKYGGIAPALGVEIVANPLSGDTLVVKTDIWSQTLVFGIDVAIGLTPSVTMDNLSTYLSTLTWLLSSSTSYYDHHHDRKVVAISEKDSTASKSSLRAYGTAPRTCAAGSTSTVLNVSGGGLTVDAYIGLAITFTSGALSGKTSYVVDNSATTITVSPAFSAAPVATDAFNVSTCNLISFATNTTVKSDYQNGTISDLPTADPGANKGRAGFSVKGSVIGNFDNYFSISSSTTYRLSGGPPATWQSVSGSNVNYYSVGAGNTFAGGLKIIESCQATLYNLTTYAVFAGGITDNTGSGPNRCGWNPRKNTQYISYANMVGGAAWTAGGDLSEARCQAQSIADKLTGTKKALVIGGRSLNRSAYGLVSGAYLTSYSTTNPTTWNFDELTGGKHYGAVTLNAPGALAKTSFGKVCNFSLNYSRGLYVDSLFDYSAAGAITSANLQELLNGTTNGTDCSFTWWQSGYMGVANPNDGVLFAHGKSPGVAPADNYLIAFKYSTANDKFFFEYQYDNAGNTKTCETTDTVSNLIPASAKDGTYIQYLHFALTREVVAGTYTFKLYINAELIDTWTGCPLQDSDTNGNGGNYWYFGGDGAFPGLGFPIKCYLDHFSITESALSQAELQQIYNYECGTLYPVPGDVDLALSPVGVVLNSCEFVTEAGVTSLAAPMAYCRYGFGLTKLPDGRIIVAGGIGYKASPSPEEYAKTPEELELNSAEIYDPSTGLWSLLPNMNEQHSYPAIGYDVNSNRVYIMGGFNSDRIEYLDVETMTWSVCKNKMNQKIAFGTGGLTNGCLVLTGCVKNSSGIYVTETINEIVVLGEETVRGGGINDLHKVTAVNGKAFTIQTPEHTSWTYSTTGSVMVVHAPTSSIDGPYIFSPQEGVGITGTSTTTSVQLDKGRSYRFVDVANASQFPDEEGYLVFNWGYENQVGPVKYLRRNSSTKLQLDPNYKFAQAVTSGSTVILLETAGPYVPTLSGPVGGFFLTDSPAGRKYAEQLLEDISAAGIDLDVTVRYPGDRGLGGEGLPARSNYRITDAVAVWGGDDLDGEIKKAKE